MRRLILFETEKLCKKKVLILFSFLMLSLLLIRFYDRCRKRDYLDQDLYHEYQERYTGLETEDLKEKVTQEAEDLAAGIMMQNLLQSGIPEEQALVMLTEEAAARGISAEEYLRFCVNLAEETQDADKVSVVLNTLRSQYDYIQIYKNFLEKFPERAEKLKTISSFSGENTYAYRSIDKSLSDFGKLHSVEIRPDLENGVEAIAEFDYSLFFIAMLILLCGSVLYTEDEDNHLHQFYLTAEKGHFPLALGKLIALTMFTAVFVLLLFGAKLVIAGNVLGFGDTSRTLQSLSCFRNCCYAVSVRGFLFLSVLFPLMISLFLSVFVSCLCTLFSKGRISVLITGIYMAVSFFCFRQIPDNSAVNVLKYINPFALFDTGRVFSVYTNVNLIGYPCTLITTIIVSGILFSSVLIILYLLSYSERLKVAVPTVRLKRKIKIRGSVSLVVHEAYRLIIPAFGIVTLTAVIILSYSRVIKEPAALTSEDYYYYAYGQEISGPISHDTENWFTEKRIQLSEEQTVILSEDNADESTVNQQLKVIDQKNKALERVYIEYHTLLRAYEKGILVHYISTVTTDPVVKDQNAFLLHGMLLMILLSFSAGHLFSEEEETGLVKLVKTTESGRGKVFLARYIAIFILYLFSFIAFEFPVFYNWMVIYKMNDFSAPIQSIIDFSGINGHMTIGSYTILWVIQSFICGALLLAGNSCLSAFAQKKSTVLTVSSVGIIVDFLLVIVDFPAIKYMGAASGFGLTVLLSQLASTGWLYLILMKNTGLLVLLIFVHWHRREKLL